VRSHSLECMDGSASVLCNIHGGGGWGKTDGRPHWRIGAAPNQSMSVRSRLHPERVKGTVRLGQGRGEGGVGGTAKFGDRRVWGNSAGLPARPSHAISFSALYAGKYQGGGEGMDKERRIGTLLPQ